MSAVAIGHICNNCQRAVACVGEDIDEELVGKCDGCKAVHVIANAHRLTKSPLGTFDPHNAPKPDFPAALARIAALEDRLDALTTPAPAPPPAATNGFA